MYPSLTGFQWFITNIMGINSTVLPTDSPVIAWVFEQSLNTVSLMLNQCGLPGVYQQAVYNLAGDFLINSAQDQPGQTFFADLRAKFNINSFIAGVVSNASDNSTTVAEAIPFQFNSFTIADLQNLKTPYGRQYLSLAQKVGNVWGIS
jgi:hypothetical protein